MTSKAMLIRIEFLLMIHRYDQKKKTAMEFSMAGQRLLKNYSTDFFD